VCELLSVCYAWAGRHEAIICAFLVNLDRKSQWETRKSTEALHTCMTFAKKRELIKYFRLRMASNARAAI
jgi:hypothetical protein